MYGEGNERFRYARLSTCLKAFGVFLMCAEAFCMRPPSASPVGGKQLTKLQMWVTSLAYISSDYHIFLSSS